jgi:hypothetical protein
VVGANAMIGMDARTLARFKELWADGDLTLADIAKILRYRESTLAKLRSAYGLPPRGIGGRPRGREYVPTPQEIAKAAARERAKWTPEQWMAAKVGIAHTVYGNITRYDDGTQ